jgi:sulfite reductase (NADPH) hemoprotein beta-component
MAPEKLAKRVANKYFLSIFVTPTYDCAGGGGFPSMLCTFWEYLNTSCKEDAFASKRYSVFGLGSTMYSSFEEELFNRAAKQLDRKLEELGGDRVTPVGLGDDMDKRHYRDGLDKWMDALLPTVVQKIEVMEMSSAQNCESNSIPDHLVMI